jgi:hypothetical protein
MTDYRVDCITKPDRTSRRERIQRLGGQSPSPWNDTEDNVITAIRNGHTFHTYVDRYRAEVVIDHRNGVPYLKTTADSSVKDNLLHLPECGR